MLFRSNRTVILLLILTTISSGMIIPVIASQDDFSVANGKITVMFEGNNPHIKFFLNKNENSSKSHYKLIFSSLIEYTDSDNDSIFTNGIDDQVESISLESINFEHLAGNTSDGGITIRFTSMDFCQCNPDLMMTIRIYLYKQNQELLITGTDSSGVTTVETVAVEGNTEFKFDVEIRNWAFSSEDNRLALNIKILANSIFSHPSDNNNNTSGIIESRNSRERPYINYPGKAIADGEVVDIKADFTEKGVSNQDLQFNFPSFTSELIYDPVIGIDELSAVNAEGLLLFIGVFPVIYIYRRKKQK